jgi:hypothetical protein
VGLRIGGDDVGPVPSPGGRPGDKKDAASGGSKLHVGSGDSAYSLPVATNDAFAARSARLLISLGLLLCLLIYW